MVTFAALAIGACLNVMSPAPPRIAIVIDDLGNRPAADSAALALPGAVTYAILPFSPAAEALARHARAQGRDILLHLPMEADSHNQLLGPGALLGSMSRGEFSAAVQQALVAVPYLSGVNNHMGSLLTRDPQRMAWLMAELRAAGLALFLDSRTTSHSVAAHAAHQAQVPFIARDVFLDNQPNIADVRIQFDRLLAHARRHDVAVGIGHPHPATLAVLRERLGALDPVRLVPLTELLRARDCLATTAVVQLPLPAQSQYERDETDRTE